MAILKRGIPLRFTCSFMVVICGFASDGNLYVGYMAGLAVFSPGQDVKKNALFNSCIYYPGWIVQ